MPRLLHIQSSPQIGNSVTRVLSDKFVQTWTASHKNVDVELLDLALEPLPHFGPSDPAGRRRRAERLVA